MSDSEKKLYFRYLRHNLKNYSAKNFVLTANNFCLLTSNIVDAFSSMTSNDSLDFVKGLALTAMVAIDFRALYAIHTRTKKQVAFTPRKEDEAIYLECLKLYKEYLSRFCDLICKFDFKDTLELCIFLDKCFVSGFFSSTGVSEYQIFKKDYDCRYLDLYGTRVLTGKSVCRHNTVLSVDILKMLGKTAHYLPVSSCNVDERIEYNKVPIISNHAITGIVENNKRFAFDFTWHVDSYFDDVNSARYGVDARNNLYLAPYLLRQMTDFTDKENGYILVHKPYYENELKDFYVTPDKSINDVDWNLYVALGDIIFNRYYSKLRTFFESNVESLEKISSLSKRLIPCYDTKK